MARHGENIHKRKDGRWEARYIHHYDHNHAVYRSIYGKSYTEVKEKRIRAMIEETDSQNPVSVPNISFQMLAEVWLSSKKDWIKESTYTRYHYIIQKYLVPEIGDYDVCSLTQEDIESLVLSLQFSKFHLSPKTILDIKTVLQAILKFGELKGLHKLSIKHLPGPRREKQTVGILTKADQQALEKILRSRKNDRIAFGIILTLYTGLRIGEVCGLQWGDINSLNGTIHVSRTVLRINNLDEQASQRTKLVVQKPKSDHSDRIIPIPDGLRALVEEYRKADPMYILTGTEKIMEPRTLQKKLKKYLLQANITDCTFHSLRHTFATRCVESGVDIKSLSEIMGHSSVTTTMQMYVHPSLDSKREQLNKMARWMTD